MVKASSQTADHQTYITKNQQKQTSPTWVRKPYIIQSTRPKAMHALHLVGTNNDVGERSAVLDLKDSIAVASFGLALAVHATIVHVHAAVEALTCGNRVDGV
jgi:hypothetical protein